MEVANDCFAMPEFRSKRGFLFLEPFGRPGLRRMGEGVSGLFVLQHEAKHIKTRDDDESNDARLVLCMRPSGHDGAFFLFLLFFLFLDLLDGSAGAVVAI